MLPVLAVLHLALQSLVPAVAAQATIIQVSSSPVYPPAIPSFPYSSIISPVLDVSTACPAGSDLVFASPAASNFTDVHVAGPTNSSSNVRNNRQWYTLFNEDTRSPAVQVNEYSSIAGCQAGDPRAVTRVFLFGIERCVNYQSISYTDGAFVTKSCSDNLCRSCYTIALIDNTTAPAQCTQSNRLYMGTDTEMEAVTAAAVTAAVTDCCD
ncbi:hypothetical protein BC831DRAFT_436406 [Entophlyctis helioformis]|nr:hypothetical protein BC831DRAFT_436406 [Entophlyctis helioformis]